MLKFGLCLPGRRGEQIFMIFICMCLYVGERGGGIRVANVVYKCTNVYVGLRLS